LKFSPETVNASPGDFIFFRMQQKNHSVTESTLVSPCVPKAGGFDSGFQTPLPNGDPYVVALEIKQTAPVWVYCRQGTHCRSGMVFAVNPGNDMEAFRRAATGATSNSSVPPAVSSTSAPTPSSSPASGSGTQHKVIVGAAGLTFNPSNITAQPGDTIVFEFQSKNHTVTGSSFEEPCREVGFDSGFKPVSPGSSSFPTYNLQVNDTKPIWAFCKQGNHCAQGMVFSANAVESSEKNFAAFQARAKESTSGTYSSPSPSATSAAWRPGVGSSAMAVILGFSAAAFLL
jgi:plastocyanin